MRDALRRPVVCAAVCAVLAAALSVGLGLLVSGLTGSDAAGTGAIEASHPAYRPWFSSPWQPGSRATEIALFGLQAALGGGALGWVVAALRERHRQRAEVG